MQFVGYINKFMGCVKLLVNGSINSQLLLLEIGFVQSANDHSLFIKSKGYVFLALLVYVDDMIIASNDMATVIDLKYTLSERFNCKRFGPSQIFFRYGDCTDNCWNFYLSAKTCTRIDLQSWILGL